MSNRRKVLSLIGRIALLNVSAVLAIGITSHGATAQSIPPDVLVVDGSAPIGGDGRSWTTAYKYLQDALSEARDDSNDPLIAEIWVKAGSYRPDQGGGQDPHDRNATFDLRPHPNLPLQPLRIMGGFAGNETNKNDRRPYEHLTYLTGDLLDNDDPNESWTWEDNSHHVVSAIAQQGPPLIGIDENIVLDGFIVTGGNAQEGPAVPGWGFFPEGGGGIIIVGNPGLFHPVARPSIVRCRFTKNRGFNSGAAFVRTNRMTFTNCEFTNDYSLNAAVYTNYVEPQPPEPIAGIPCGEVPITTFVNCLVTWNYRGGIYSGGGGTVELINCTVAKNSVFGVISPDFEDECNAAQIQNSILYFNGDGLSNHQILGDYCAINSNIQEVALPCSPFPCEPGAPCGGTFSLDPLFMDPDGANDIGGDSDDNFRLQPNSPCIDAGSDPIIEAVEDIFDLNQNNITTEVVPDLDQKHRIFNQTDPCNDSDVDLGPYEFGAPGCPADTDGDCDVDVDDLLAVINGWGACAGTCPGDIAPADNCGGNDVVDVDDLLMVINNWGECPACGAVGGEESMPQSVGECMDRCSDRYPEGGENWSRCVNDCVEALCQAQIIECD